MSKIYEKSIDDIILILSSMLLEYRDTKELIAWGIEVHISPNIQ